MKEKSAVFSGLSAGGLVATCLLFLGIPAAYIAFVSAAALFLCTGGSVLILTALGWPRKSLHSMDVYDFNKFVIASTLTAAGIAFLSAAAVKVANILSINLFTSLMIAVTFIASYMFLGHLLYVFVRRR